MKNDKYAEMHRTPEDPMDLAPYRHQGPLKLNDEQGMYELYYDFLVATFDNTSRLYENSKNPNDGHFSGPMVTNSGCISQDNINVRANAITFGAAYIDSSHNDNIEKHDLVPYAIVNTRNEGFMYVGEDEKGNLKATAPVSHACFVGGTDRPAAVLIPLNGEIAPITDGMKILCDVEKAYRNSINEIDIPKGSPRAELPKAPFEDDIDENDFEVFKFPDRFI